MTSLYAKLGVQLQKTKGDCFMTSTVPEKTKSMSRPYVTDTLLFGVDSETCASTKLQNNLTEFEWVRRNKVYPIFWGRYINGENALSSDEIRFLREKCCKIALQYLSEEIKNTEGNGRADATKAMKLAKSLNIPQGVALFLEIPANEVATGPYLKGFSQAFLEGGYTPGFKVNTDAEYSFDREFGGAYRAQEEIMRQSLIWAVAPTLEEFDQINTTHLIQPKLWKPYAPGVLRRTDIAIWQYGKDCHKIFDDDDNLTQFNINLVRDESIIINKMY